MTGDRDLTQTTRPAAEDDAILRTGPRAVRSEGVQYAMSGDGSDAGAYGPTRTAWGRRTSENGDGRYQGWLPGAQPLTFGEIFAGIAASALVWLVVAISLALAQDYLTQLPEPVANNHTLVSRLCGLACGLCLTVRLRGSRLARRAHLRGER